MRMSVQAMTWVLEDAPDLPAHLVSTLMALANHADRNGQGAYPAQSAIAWYTRQTARTVRRSLRELETLGLVREGDQRLVGHIRADRRPVVYDLAMDRKRSREDTDDRTPTSVRDVSDDRTPVTPRKPTSDRTPASPRNATTTGRPRHPVTVPRPDTGGIHDRTPVVSTTGRRRPPNLKKNQNLNQLPPPHGGQRARIAAALDVEEEDAEKVYNHVLATRRPGAPSRYIDALVASGDLKTIADEILDRRPPRAAYTGPTHVFAPDPSGQSCDKCGLPAGHARHSRSHLRAEAFAERTEMGTAAQSGQGGYSAVHVVCDEMCDYSPSEWLDEYDANLNEDEPRLTLAEAMAPLNERPSA
jgi:hypothetical protein